jgi:Putative beta-barrel porin-2, OmpL-like. bbp2
LPRHTATRVCATSLCLLASLVQGYATADDLTGVPRADDPRDRAPNASGPSTRQVARANTTPTTKPPDLPPLPDFDSDQPSQGATGAGRPSARRVVPGVAPNEVQQALDAGAGAGGVSLPRSAENAATQVQLQLGPSTGGVELLMRFFRTENEPVRIYGWLDNSYTQNTNGRPRNDSNFTVFPNRGANQWQGNQYYFIVENPLESNVDYVNLGFRLDNLVGNDWQFSKSYGLFDRAFHDNTFGGVDLPQMYGSIHLPILTPLGMDVIGGRFYSPAGFESVMAVKRPLLSTSYSFSFTPFTLFGTETILHLNERVNLINGAVNGWDRWIDSNYRYSYLGGISYTSRDNKTSLSSVILTGPDQLPRYAPANSPFLPTGVVTNSVLQGRENPYYTRSNRTYMSNVVSHSWSSKLTEALEVFFVHENLVQGLGPGGPTHVNNESAWYGACHWYLYQFTPKVTGVYRAEIFRDQNGAATGSADNYYEQTIGLIFKPKPWIWLRPEARYDWAQFHTPFNDGTRGSQLTLAFDVIFQF